MNNKSLYAYVCLEWIKIANKKGKSAKLDSVCSYRCSENKPGNILKDAVLKFHEEKRESTGMHCILGLLSSSSTIKMRQGKKNVIVRCGYK